MILCGHISLCLTGRASLIIPYSSHHFHIGSDPNFQQLTCHLPALGFQIGCSYFGMWSLLLCSDIVLGVPCRTVFPTAWLYWCLSSKVHLFSVSHHFQIMVFRPAARVSRHTRLWGVVLKSAVCETSSGWIVFTVNYATLCSSSGLPAPAVVATSAMSGTSSSMLVLAPHRCFFIILEFEGY